MIDRIGLSGPLDRPPHPAPALRRRVVPCDVATEGEACARSALATFTRRAWRREIAAAELDRLVALAATDAGAGSEGWEGGLRAALRAALLSPHFLFRPEAEAPPGGAPAQLSGAQLATRLATFVWSGLPDDTLLDAAAAGALDDPDGLAAHATRMLADPRADALVSRFGAQWMSLPRLDDAVRDAVLHPRFSEAIRADMATESARLFEAILRDDRPMLELLDADYSFLSPALADYYGLEHPGGDGVARVPLGDGPRRGLLTHGSVLTLTSHTFRTSPTIRGRWILSKILCDEPDPPPPGVDALPPREPDDAPLTVREQMELHRSHAFCYACHQAMDPLGFALEGFDAVGARRDHDEQGLPIDDRGELPDGRVFTGARDLVATLRADPAVPRCFVRHLLTYALGRSLEATDDCVVERLAAAWSDADHRIGALVELIVRSEPFRWRAAAPGAAAPEAEVSP